MKDVWTAVVASVRDFAVLSFCGGLAFLRSATLRLNAFTFSLAGDGL